MVSLSLSTTSPFFLFFLSSTAVTLFLAPSSCCAASGRKNAAEDKPASSDDGDGKLALNDADSIYFRLGVEPPQNRFRVLKFMGHEFPLSRWSWKLHGRLLPLLHLFDGDNEEDRPPDVFVNLRVLWCKLLTSLDPNSLAYEGPKTDDPSTTNIGQDYFITYRMLPPYSIKWALRRLGLWRCFPRWMHANIELRTVYLQGALHKVLKTEENEPNTVAEIVVGSNQFVSNDNTHNVCVISLGGGYDSHGAKLSTSSAVQRVYELDLPQVVDSKRRLLHRAGCRVLDDVNKEEKNRKLDSNSESAIRGVRLEGVDLNVDGEVDRVLDKIQQQLILSTKDGDPEHSLSKWQIIVIAEAVLMYLKPGKAERVLEGLVERFHGKGCMYFTDASFVFADRLIKRDTNASNEGNVMQIASSANRIEDTEETKIRQWLLARGWKLQELLFKPGATRHLGIATT